MQGDVKKILEQLKQHFERLYGDRLEKMILFGSRARGDFESESDIDVLVVLRGIVSPSDEIDRTSEIVANLSLQNECVISCVFMEKAELDRGRGPLVRNVLREGVAL